MNSAGPLADGAVLVYAGLMLPEKRTLLRRAAELALAPVFVLWRRPWIAVLAPAAFFILREPFNLGAEWFAATTALVAFVYALPHSRSSR